MKDELRKRWTDALRSGQYKQGREWLCRNGNYCCLGVACEVFKEDVGLAVTSGEYKGSEVAPYTYTEYNGGGGNLPVAVQNLLGINGLGQLPPQAREDIAEWDKSYPLSLVSLNDELFYDFNKIADVIDKYFAEEAPKEGQSS